MGIFKSRSRKPAAGKTPDASKPRQSSAPRFRAVEIQSSSDACRAAKDLRGQRHLCDAAPLLPLKDCDRPGHCACSYAHFADRRQSPRRKSEGALPSESQGVQAQERRRDQGRRTEELDQTGRRRSWFKEV